MIDAFILKSTAEGEFYFVLVNKKGEAVLTTPKYASEESFEEKLQELRTYGADVGNYVIQDPRLDKVRFDLVAGTRNVLATSREYLGYEAAAAAYNECVGMTNGSPVVDDRESNC